MNLPIVSNEWYVFCCFHNCCTGHPVSFEKLTIVIYPPTANTFIGVLVRGFDELISVFGGIGHDGAIDASQSRQAHTIPPQQTC
jgi:hypothetical protein